MNRVKKRLLIMSLLGMSSFFIGLGLQLTPNEVEESVVIETNPNKYLTYSTENFRYLSDIPYIKDQSSVGWGNITLDANLDASKNNGLIALIVNNQPKLFLKGITAHATSTVIYDVSEYDYDYFSTYYGVDAGRGTLSDGVKFAIYTSVDGQNWDLETQVSPPIKKGTSEAEHVNINIKDKKYIKLYCKQHGSAGSDHCTYGDAKLYKEGYSEEEENVTVDFIKTVGEYDEIIKSFPSTDLSQEQELVLLQRTLVNNIGYDLFQGFTKLNNENTEAISYLMKNLDVLKLYVMGGKPTGSYINSLKVWTQLYHNYHVDWDIKQTSKYGAVIGEVYKKMAVALSLTHSAQVALWMQPSHPSNQSDAVTRYAIFKKLYSEGKFKVTDSIDITEWFEDYTVEEMRFVMNNIIDDESILWLHDYTQKQIDANPKSAWSLLTPHPYMAYVWPNYANPVFHDQAKKEYWDTKYEGVFSKYGVTYSTENDMVYKVWMNFRNEFNTGAVCGGISKTGSNIRTVHGIPAAVIGQPGHAAIIYYTRNSEGKGYWGIDNDVSGWALSEKGERMLLGWGNDRSYAVGYTVPYMVMAQEALNRFDEYQKSAELVMLANSYASDVKKKEFYLRKALDSLNFNIDAWWELIKLYNSDDNRSEEDYYNLAKEIGEALMPFPLPMKNLFDQIKGKFTSVEYQFKYSLLETRLLTEGKNYTSNDIVLQPAVTRILASYLLGKTDTSLATFSFDGEDAGKIVLSSRFDTSGIRWDYSLDGKKTWNEVAFVANEEHKLQLTPEQLEFINDEDDIYIHIVGVNYDDENLYKIDIQTQNAPSTIYNNDLENKVIGATDIMEWKMADTTRKTRMAKASVDDQGWISFKEKTPDLTGDKTVYVRFGKNGIYLPSDFVTLKYTKDDVNEKRKYISISHLSIEEVSSEATSNQGSAAFAIDGNYNTRWHSAWNGSDTQRFITIKLDEPMYVSAVEFVPAGGGNGKIYDGTVWGSMDGEDFEVLSQQKNLKYTNQANTNADAIANTKSFEIATPKKVQYIKIVADRSNGNWFTARAFNLYEDTTKSPKPTAVVSYNIDKLTNKDVVATISSSNKEITIINNDGKNTYTFIKNGEFTFEFKDADGNVGSIVAKVDWIDKEIPTASISYNITALTSKDVIATLKDASEEITITNNDGKNTYTFTENGSFEFIYEDKAGNVGKAIAKVNWIDKEAPKASISYDITSKTSKSVTATLVNESEPIIIVNNNGKNTYTFTKNGSFEFVYQDKVGNVSTTTAKVDWIVPESQTPGDTEKPGEDNKPSEPEAPGDTEKPGEDNKPSEPEAPGDTEKPGEDNKPSEPEAPGDTEKPGEDNNPSEPGTPGDTEKPGENNKPSKPGAAGGIDHTGNQGNTSNNNQNYEIVTVPNTDTKYNIFVTAMGILVVSSGFAVVHYSTLKK